MSELSEACAAWQSSRNDGSSLLRGAARVLTGTPHYFSAPFITAYEDRARDDPRALDRARTLLEAVRDSDPRTAGGWREHCLLTLGDFAGRGLASKPEDDQILAVLAAGEISMPLWGVSLDPQVATSFGSRFLFVLDGPFHGIAAWTHSNAEAAQLEIITGGRYEVVRPPRQVDETTIIALREVALVTP